MRKVLWVILLIVILIVIALVLDMGKEEAEPAEVVELRPFEIRARNISLDTTLSPGVFVIHTDEFSMNYEGTTSPGELEPLAEYGDNTGFSDFLAGQPGVIEVIPDSLPLPAGEEMSLFVEVNPDRKPLFSSFHMLTTTNDGVVLVDSAPLYNEDGSAFLGPVSSFNYDNGTEENEEPGGGFEAGQPDTERGEENIDNGVPTVPQGLFVPHEQFQTPALEVSIIPDRTFED